MDNSLICLFCVRLIQIMKTVHVQMRVKSNNKDVDELYIYFKYFIMIFRNG